MFTVVAKTFQQIMTELNWAESEDTIMAITKFVLKLTKKIAVRVHRLQI
jgi:hypothetical protein